MDKNVLIILCVYLTQADQPAKSRPKHEFFCHAVDLIDIEDLGVLFFFTLWAMKLFGIITIMRAIDQGPFLSLGFRYASVL